MDIDRYKIAIQNYCKDTDELLDNLVAEGIADAKIAIESKQRSREKIEKALKENEAYGRFLLILTNNGKPERRYLSLTDIARSKNQENPSYVIQSWLRNKNTIQFLRIWEINNNSEFNDEECRILFEQIKVPSFTLTAKKWIAKTGAIGIMSKQGNNGGTLAHRDIVLDFQMWLSPERRYDVIRVLAGDMVEG